MNLVFHISGDGSEIELKHCVCKRIVLACFVTSSLASITELIATLDFRYKVCYDKIVASLSFSTRGTPEGYSNVLGVRLCDVLSLVINTNSVLHKCNFLLEISSKIIHGYGGQRGYVGFWLRIADLEDKLPLQRKSCRSGSWLRSKVLARQQGSQRRPRKGEMLHINCFIMFYLVSPDTCWIFLTCNQSLGTHETPICNYF